MRIFQRQVLKSLQTLMLLELDRMSTDWGKCNVLMNIGFCQTDRKLKKRLAALNQR